MVSVLSLCPGSLLDAQMGGVSLSMILEHRLSERSLLTSSVQPGGIWGGGAGGNRGGGKGMRGRPKRV